MPRENGFGLLKSVLLIFLLIFGVFWKHCDSQVNTREEANKPPDGRRGDGSAFFAMRSCQQLLRGDNGEFFSPDYLCSNPPLWCNWTIQVDPAKRIHLHLEDLTPDDGCLLKEDQVHVDEPAGGHRVLQRCWREAKYTSASNTLYVVLLIGGWPSPPYRGFYGRYRAFGPPVVYNPQEEFTTEANGESEPSAAGGLVDVNEIVMNEEQMDSGSPGSASPANADLVYDYYDQPSEAAGEREHEEEAADTNTRRRGNRPPGSETNRRVHPSNDGVSTAPTLVRGTARSERRAAPTPSARFAPPRQRHGGQNRATRPTASSPKTTQTNVEEASAYPEEASAYPEEASAHPEEASAHPEEASAHPEEASAHPEEASAHPREASAHPREASAHPREASAHPGEASAHPEGEASAHPEGEASAHPGEASAHPGEAAVPEEEVRSAAGENGTAEVRDASDQLPVPSGAPEPEKTEQTHRYAVEPLSDHRGNFNIRNHSDVPHLPGDHLFEVALEVSLRPGFEETWDDLSRSLLLPVKALISEQMKALRTPLSMSSKRIKRLSTGVLYILWLQIAQEHGGPHVHKVLLSGLQGLVTAGNDVGGNRRNAVLIFVSIADVNECGTRLVLCDANADCVNQFGSYSCRCRPGFQDKSRQGSGGTLCVAACSSGLSAETKGVYVLFFLLSFLILMLLVAAGLLYHRHHQGEFLVRCRGGGGGGSPPDPNNSPHLPPHCCCRHHHHDASDLPPPPPPPARGFRESWPQTKERCYPVADLPLLSYSPLRPPDGFKEAGK